MTTKKNAHDKDEGAWQFDGLRPTCKRLNCMKRTVLSVSKTDMHYGRFYWGCPVHGVSEWAKDEDKVHTSEDAGSMNATLLSEFEFVPQHNSRRERAKYAAKQEQCSMDQQQQHHTEIIQAPADKYNRVRQLVCLNLILLAVYLLVQIIKA